MTFSLLGLAAMMTGCSSPSTVEEAQDRDRAAGAGLGAAIGGGIGNLFGKETNVDRGTSTAVGAGVGGVAGAAAGNEMAKKRGDYAAELKELDDAIADTKSQLVEIERQTAAVEGRVASQHDVLSRLNQQANRGEVARGEAARTLETVEASLKAQRAATIVAQAEFEVLNTEIARADELLASYPGEQDLITRKGTLVGQRGDLTQRLNRLAGAQTTLMAQRDRAQTLAGG